MSKEFKVDDNKILDEIKIDLSFLSRGKNDQIIAGRNWKIFRMKDLLWRKQIGPTCGFVALEMGVRALTKESDGRRRRRRTTTTTLAIEESSNENSHFFWERMKLSSSSSSSSSSCCSCAGNVSSDRLIGQSNTEESIVLPLVEAAQEWGLTKQGEMFCAEGLAAVARSCFGVDAVVMENWRIRDVVAAISHGFPVLIPHDRDGSNRPTKKQGKCAHWAVVNGFAYFAARKGEEEQRLDMEEIDSEEATSSISFDEDSEEENWVAFICQHGMSRRVFISWGGELWESCNQLVSFPEHRGEMVIPSDGPHLARRIVILKERS